MLMLQIKGNETYDNIQATILILTHTLVARDGKKVEAVFSSSESGHATY